MAKEWSDLSGCKFIVEGPGSRIHIIMGSASDMPVVNKAVNILEKFQVPFAVTVASAHRTPDIVETTVRESADDAFIAVAGLSAALPGVVASLTQRPVIGVPVSGKVNMDSILSVVQMPPGIPVGSVGLDRGENAALLALKILAVGDGDILSKLEGYSLEMREKVIRSGKEVLGE